MSASFWAIKAANNKKNEVVPGTSKWVANELYCMNSDVLTNTEKFYQDISSGIDELNEFMKGALDGQENKLFVASVADREATRISEVASKGDMGALLDEGNIASEARTNGSSDFTYISPENQNRTSPVESEAASPQSSPVTHDINNSNTTRTTSRFTPKTPSPLKQDYRSELATSPNADLSFIPITNTINPNKQLPQRQETQNPSRETEKITLPLAADDSFQAISTAIRKSIAGKSANNPRTSQFVHIERSPKATNTSPKEVKKLHREYTTLDRTSSNRGLDPNGISIPLKDDNSVHRKSDGKTPKRASMFVSLPSREPITISSSSNPSGRFSGIRSRSLRVFEKLEIASRNENIPASVDQQSPTSKKRKIQRQTENYTGFSSTYIKESLKRRSYARPLPQDQNKHRVPQIKMQEGNEDIIPDKSSESKTIPQIKQSNQNSKHQDGPQFTAERPWPVVQETEIPIKSKEISPVREPFTSSMSKERSNSKLVDTKIPKLEKGEEISGDIASNHTVTGSSSTKSPIINSIGSVLRRARNVFMSNPRSAGLQYESANFSSHTGSPSSRSRSPTKLSLNKLAKGHTRSPIRKSTMSSNHTPRSPIKLLNKESSDATSRLSPKFNNTESDSNSTSEPKSIQGKAEADLINRLMVPTSASAAKNVKAPVSKVQETKKNENTIKNKFLTTTLNPTKPQFNPGKNTKLLQSPMKRDTQNHEESDAGIPSKLEFSSIPSLKKKSLMAERSEAAAQKPKQRIMIAMNHKLDMKLQANTPTLKPDAAVSSNERLKDNSINGKKSFNISSDTGDMQNMNKSVSGKPNYGNLPILPEASKPTNMNLDSRDHTKRPKTESKTPSRPKSLAKQKILEKKASRISTNDKKTPHKGMNTKGHDIFHDPKTPGTDKKLQMSEVILPDIPTDDEDNKTDKVLQSWAETPQLQKIVMRNRSIDPVSIFGEVPRLNIEEIFESQASRYRGKSSPSNFTPNEKQRKREASEYAINMGYKDAQS